MLLTRYLRSKAVMLDVVGGWVVGGMVIDAPAVIVEDELEETDASESVFIILRGARASVGGGEGKKKLATSP
jgi:hypothetical protein